MTTQTQTKTKQSGPGTSNGSAPVIPPAPKEREAVFVPFGGNEPITLTIGIVRTLVANKTRSGASPTDEQLIRFIMLCKARRLNPFEGDAFMVGYDSKDGPVFNLITAHQAFLKRAEVNPEYDGMESGVIVWGTDERYHDREGDFVHDGDVICGAWATVYFKHRTYPMKKRINIGPFRKDNKIWNENPQGMVVKCVEADALRSSFPTLLGSLFIEEEMPTFVETVSTSLPTGRQSLKRPQAVEQQASTDPTLEQQETTIMEPPTRTGQPELLKPSHEELAVPQAPIDDTERADLERQEAINQVKAEMRRTLYDYSRLKIYAGDQPLENASLAQIQTILEFLAAKPTKPPK
jgi:phage recombination protein Bet